MNPAEIVVHKIERDVVLQIFQFLGIAVRQPREPSHAHSHCQVLPLANTCRNVFIIGHSADDCPPRSHADCWAVAHFRPFRRSAINLLQHRVINLGTKGIFNSAQIGSVSVCGQLDAIGKATGQVVHELIGRTCVTATNEPTRHKFRFRVNRRPRPNIAMSHGLVLRRGILFLAADKRPDFVALNPLALQIPQRLVLVFGTRTARVNQQFDDAVNRRIRQSGSGADTVSVNQTTEDLSPLFSTQLIHANNICLRGQAVN